MAQVRTWAGLDVHAAKVIAASVAIVAVAVARELAGFCWAVSTVD